MHKAMGNRVLAAAAIAALATAGCTVHQTEAPPVAGPSTFAKSLTMTVTPDRITQDGASQSAVLVQAIGPDGRALSGLSVRVDMMVSGQIADYGTLSARTVVTGSDGVARVVYTAPPPAAPPADSSINTVSIRAIPIGSDAQTANGVSADIRLVPIGVILPPSGTPTAAFTITPSPVSVNVPTIFDGSTSQPGQNASQISTYSWNFGDGTGGSTGRTATHTFTRGGNYSVTLTVTNDRGLSASTTQTVTVSASDPFTGDWTFSPQPVTVNTPTLFNADAVQTSAGHQIVTFNWNFGDQDTTGQPTTGFQLSHTFHTTGSFAVVLSVADDLGRKKVFPPKLVTVSTGNPVASFSATVANAATHSISFDASASVAAPGATIVEYTFVPSSGPTIGPQSSPTTTPTSYPPGSLTVTLTVKDNFGRTGSTTITVTVP